MRAAALRSGSSGNSILIEQNGRALVVDAGLNGKTFAAALQELALTPEQVDGILITHEHHDHISGLGVILRRHRIPLYINRRTLEAALPALGKFDANLIRLTHNGEPFTVRDFEVRSFEVPHDAADPVGYRIASAGGDIAVCTDLGTFGAAQAAAMRGARLVFLEANYDLDMLQNGLYPQQLKARIRSAKGHLSNIDCAGAMGQLIQQGTEQFVLSHLSRENNFPALALLTVCDQLSEIGAKRDRDFQVSVAARYETSPPVCW